MNKPDQSPMEQSKKHNCLALLRSILDGEASDEEKKGFIEKHLDECMPCYQMYHLEMAIRDLLKSKCNNHHAPAEIIDNIRNLINTSR